jgi:hypothetical protein
MTLFGTDGRANRHGAAVVVLAAALGAMIVHLLGVIALVIPTTFAVLALIALVKALIRWPDDPQAQRRILRWTLGGFAAHLAFGLVITSLSASLPLLRSDALAYHGLADEIVRHWSTGVPAPPLPAGKEGFYYLLAGLYWVFGSHTAAGLAVNAMLAAALVPVVSDLTHRLFGVSAARYVPPLLVLLPGIFLWTSQLLKEASVLFLIALAANCAVRMTARLSLGALTGLRPAPAEAKPMLPR